MTPLLRRPWVSGTQTQTQVTPGSDDDGCGGTEDGGCGVSGDGSFRRGFRGLAGLRLAQASGPSVPETENQAALAPGPKR